MTKKKNSIIRVINHNHSLTIIAQLYSNGLINYALKGPTVATLGYMSAIFLGSAYAGEKSRSPFIKLLKWSDKVFRGATEPSPRLKRVFDGVAKNLGGDKDAYRIFSYGDCRIKPHLGRIFNRDKDIYIGPNIEEALNDDELAFAIAHSIGHSINDDFTFPSLSNAGYFLSFSNISHSVSRALENKLLEQTPSFLEGFSIVAAPFVCAAQYYVRNTLFSEINIKADEEALKLCPDKETAKSALTKLQKLEKSQNVGQKMMDYLSVHPENYSARLKALSHG